MFFVGLFYKTISSQITKKNKNRESAAGSAKEEIKMNVENSAIIQKIVYGVICVMCVYVCGSYVHEI